jgi:hypothetical protein
VEDLDALCRNVHRRLCAGLGIGQAPGEVVGIDVEQFASAGGVVDRLAPFLGELHRRLELRGRAARLRVAVAAGDHVGSETWRETSANRVSICSTSRLMSHG